MFFAQKLANNEQVSNLLRKNKRLAHLLIFGERPEPFAHSLSVVMSDLSNSLTSLFNKEGMSELLMFFWTYKKYDFIQNYF